MASPPPPKTVATINSTGRQAASFIRVASAVGWRVRAQLRSDDRDGVIANELASLPNVELIVGEPAEPEVLKRLFAAGVELAFINTTHWNDEVAVGRAVADAARRARLSHYIYSSMPDHGIFDPSVVAAEADHASPPPSPRSLTPLARAARHEAEQQQQQQQQQKPWRPLPLWAQKYAVENYIRQIGLPATFVYCGIYHNNFTSLPYPLFRLEVVSPAPRVEFEWCAPFAATHRLPWLDSEHDVGPAVLQLFKEGPRSWAGQRVPLAFAYLTPLEVCQALSAGLKRPVHYRRGPISLAVPVPVGYGDHLAALEETLGRRGAPYFGPDLEPDCTSLARQLWAGYRPLEEYASEAFPLEEAANGLRWMDVSADSATQQEQQLQKQVEELHVTPAGDDDDDDDDEGDLGAGFGGSC